MTMIFISYSQKDEAAFTSLCLALEAARLPYWPGRLKAGQSLKEQLRDAITKCDVCIFVATKNSVNSQWCLNEIGAFWGAGKRIVLYAANNDIENDLPPLFKGDFWTSNAREVIEQVREELEEIAGKASSVGSNTALPMSVQLDSELDDDDKRLLFHLAKNHRGRDLYHAASEIGFDNIDADYHADRLSKTFGLIRRQRSMGSKEYGLTTEGVKYVKENRPPLRQAIDTIKLRQAFARLKALTEHLPDDDEIEDKYVNDYHALLDTIQAETGQDFSHFRVPENELTRRERLTGIDVFEGETHTALTPERYCDRAVFLIGLRGAINYIDAFLPPPLSK